MNSSGPFCILNTNIFNPRSFTIAGSSCLNVPAAKFLAFGDVFFPASSCFSLYFSKASRLIYTSPRICNESHGISRYFFTSGIISAFAVTSSPISPSPLVSARLNFSFPLPSFSYRSVILSPSIFSSTENVASGWSCLTLFTQFVTSSFSKTSSMESIGTS